MDESGDLLLITESFHGPVEIFAPCITAHTDLPELCVNLKQHVVISVFIWEFFFYLYGPAVMSAAFLMSV